jgi:hypothetical protein
MGRKSGLVKAKVECRPDKSRRFAPNPAIQHGGRPAPKLRKRAPCGLVDRSRRSAPARESRERFRSPRCARPCHQRPIAARRPVEALLGQRVTSSRLLDLPQLTTTSLARW